jgi:hypothetical protein
MAIRLMIVSTEGIKLLDGVPVRAWLGTTEKGTKCTVYVRAIRVKTEADNGEFERELLEIAPVVVGHGD